MTNTRGLRDYNRGKRNARLCIEENGLESVRDMHLYGYCGNGSHAYQKGYSDYLTYRIQKARERKHTPC